MRLEQVTGHDRGSLVTLIQAEPYSSGGMGSNDSAFPQELVLITSRSLPKIVVEPSDDRVSTMVAFTPSDHKEKYG